MNKTVLLVYDHDNSIEIPQKVIGMFEGYDDASEYFMSHYYPLGDTRFYFAVRDIEKKERKVMPVSDNMTEEEWKVVLARTEQVESN